MPAWMDDELEERRRQGLYRERRRLTSGQGVEVRWREVDLVNFSSNDYLSYACDNRVARAAARAVLRYGTGSGASPLVSGYLPPLRGLEQELAAWEGVDAALVFPSGFATNLAVLSALAGREDAIFSDQANHASIIDGCRLSRARIHVYRHADLSHLDALLRDSASTRRRIIVSDTVFSMDGDLARLGELVELAERHDAILVLDEAHATGVIGEQGRGLTDTLPVTFEGWDRIIKVGTLSKALGSQGGFVCGSRRLIDWLIHHARPYIFSTALAPGSAAAARQAVRLIQREPQRRQHVLALADSLRTRLRALGLDVSASTCHIVPVVVGRPEDAVALSEKLERKRLLVPAIRPPSVSPGTSRLRITLSAGHTEEDVARLVEALRTA